MHKMWRVIKRNRLLPYYVLICVTIVIFARSQYHGVSVASENEDTSKYVEKSDPAPEDIILGSIDFPPLEKVTLKLFYETLCPSCIQIDPGFVEVVEKLYDNVDVYTYPYGNGRMTKNMNGSVEVECQHAEPECYGNKLHACAIDVLKDLKLYLQYNGCMMPLYSTDSAAEKCGKDLNVPVKSVRAIKTCAKGAKGHQLLVRYGEESLKAKIPFVPYVLINGVKWTQGDLTSVVCAAFENPPAACQKYL